jgi:hypothetical protein
MDKSVVILGTGMTLSKFNKSEHNGSEIWAVGSAFKVLKNTDINIDKYFCLHNNETLEFDGDIIDQNKYPLQSIISKFNSKFFTNSISYMIAFALYNDIKKISIYGVDMDSESEYEFERPSVAYWMGFARGLSVEVEIASNIDSPIFLYGFEDYSPLVKRLTDRMNWSKQMADNYLEEKDVRRADQFIGQYADNKYWLRELRG